MRGPGTKVPGPRVSKNSKNSINGKEESYERNPGRVPFVFNQEVFRTFLKFRKLAQAGEKVFSPAWDRGQKSPVLAL
jgi:hypothetical protein